MKVIKESSIVFFVTMSMSNISDMLNIMNQLSQLV